MIKTIWDQMLYDPMSLFQHKKWWLILLLILPWVAMLVLAGLWWMLNPGRMTEKSLERAKNAPLDSLNKACDKSIDNLKVQQKTLQDKAAIVEKVIENAREDFRQTRESLADSTHEELKDRLYGKDNG
jgi:cbb3-type cytochrome oxidase subunit 3